MGTPDHDRTRSRPYLLEQVEGGDWRLTLQETRFNSQNYPIVTASPVDQSFPTAARARAYAKEHYGAKAGEFATK
ncbi:MAG TPA: hypothetical protein VLK25_03345 [Allosphingosinicella sp.]|nr:hypothetical protein [Allosphingosinicella sp.]